MTFGEALVNLKNGHRAWRTGWNGADQFIFLVKGELIAGGGSVSIVGQGLCNHRHLRNLENFRVKDFLCIKTSKNEVQVGWLASQSDMLENDWETTENIGEKS